MESKKDVQIMMFTAVFMDKVESNICDRYFDFLYQKYEKEYELDTQFQNDYNPKKDKHYCRGLTSGEENRLIRSAATDFVRSKLPFLF